MKKDAALYVVRDKYGLTPKERHICDLWLSKPGVNVSKLIAQVEGGQAVSGKQAEIQLLRNPRVTDYLRMRQDEVSERLMIEREEVLRELASIGFANLRDLIDDTGAAIPPELLPAHVGAAVEQIEYDMVPHPEDPDKDMLTIKRVKMHPKLNALRVLADHLSLAPKHSETKHTIDGSFAGILADLAGAAGVLPGEPNYTEDDELGFDDSDQSPTSH